MEMSDAAKTTDHALIQRWIEERDGHPAKITTGSKEGGILRVDFGEPEEEFEPIKWQEFFEIFDDNRLAFLHQDKTDDGKVSRFNKFVERD
jgi:hypothetical protein